MPTRLHERMATERPIYEQHVQRRDEQLATAPGWVGMVDPGLESIITKLNQLPSVVTLFSCASHPESTDERDHQLYVMVAVTPAGVEQFARWALKVIDVDATVHQLGHRSWWESARALLWSPQNPDTTFYRCLYFRSYIGISPARKDAMLRILETCLDEVFEENNHPGAVIGVDA